MPGDFEAAAIAAMIGVELSNQQQADAESAGSRFRPFKILENFTGWGRRPRAVPTGLRVLSRRRSRMLSAPGAVGLISQCLLIRWLKAEDTSEKHRQRFASSRIPDIFGMDRPSMAGRFPPRG